MRKSVLLVVLCVSISVFSQKKEKTLITIDGEKITVSEFKRVYEKNLDVIDNEEAKNIAKNLELFINYKLKVKEAYQIKLDTFPSYIREVEKYRNQLSAPYLKDTTFIEKLAKDAYYRTKNEVKAKHILIRTPKDATPNDTLIAYNKILKIRDKILNNGDFETIASEVSEDESAKDNPKNGTKGNKGNLGYFSAFRMVFPFEEAAYTTKEGEISMPFRSQFGYHILKVDDFRVSKGEVELAHILITDTTSVGKMKIDKVFTKLNTNEKFEELAKQYSDDTRSKNDGGKIGKFGTGRLPRPFENVAFSLSEENSFSKPFKTSFGWHIVKLIKKHPIKSYDEMREELTSRIKKSARIKVSKKAIVNKLKNNYKVIENEKAKNILNRKDIRAIPKDSLQQIILSINTKDIKQELFIEYIKNRNNKPVFELFDMFKSNEIIKHFKENLIYTEPEYASTIREYENGLLLFELMQQKIWDKSSKDSIGLKKYFNANINAYKNKELKEIKGQVINDYQNFLEKEWIADLRSKSKIKVRKKELKKLTTSYSN